MKETNDNIALLLIESEKVSREILLRTLQHAFPKVCISPVISTEEALNNIRKYNFQVIVCAANLLVEDKVSFLSKVCKEQDPEPVVIAISADTNVKLDNFPRYVQGTCVCNVVYKPLELAALIKAVENALNKVRTRTDV